MSLAIYNAESLESATCSPATAEEVFNRLANPHSEYFIVTRAGDLLDLRQKLPESITGKIYLFKKSSVDTNCAELEPLEHFFIPSYCKEPINFYSYQNLQKIELIEKELFENQQKAMNFYATYMRLQDYFVKTKPLADIRVKAGDSLRIYMEKFTKSREKEFEVLKEEVNSLDLKVLNYSSNFKEKLRKIRENTVLDDIKELIHSSLQETFKVIDDKTSKLKRNIKEIEKIFENANQVLFDAENSFLQAKPNIKQGLLDIEKKRPFFDYDFTDLLHLIDDYSRFKRLFMEAHGNYQSSQKREQLERDMQTMEFNVVRGKNELKSYEKMLEGPQSTYKAIFEIRKRIERVYKLMSIPKFVEISHEIKYFFSDKLTVFKKKIRKIDQLTEFLTIPEKIEEAFRAAENEENNSSLKMLEIQDLYVGLCQVIIKDHIERKTFLQKFGSILPRDVCAALNTPVLSRGNLRQAVKIQPSLELPESQVRQMSKTDLIRYYEGLIASKEQSFTKQSNELKFKEKKLQDHYVNLVKYKKKIQRDAQNQEILLKNYLNNLHIRKQDGFEIFAERFQREVEKLKEKEKVFKEIYLVNLKSLQSENDSLLSSSET